MNRGRRHLPGHATPIQRASLLLTGWFLCLCPGMAPADDTSPMLLPQPVYQHQTESGTFELSLKPPLLETNAAPMFFAVVSHPWPPGMVPLFEIRKSKTYELRSRPRPGRESSSHPLFFAYPLPHDTATSKLSGRWDVLSVDCEDTRNDYGWDFAVEGTNVMGRFDPDTDYRFAYVSGGTFVSNKLSLNVEYINQRYRITGVWNDGALNGVWRQRKESSRGTWHASRANTEMQPVTDGFDLVRLYEWRHRQTGVPRYSPEGTLEKSEWTRQEPPLGRVWIRPRKGGPSPLREPTYPG